MLPFASTICGLCRATIPPLHKGGMGEHAAKGLPLRGEGGSRSETDEVDTQKSGTLFADELRLRRMEERMNITVYLGATPGSDPALEPAVRELGTWIGANGHNLVYGGSKCGLMGMLAESVLASGGKVFGVEPQFFVDAGFVYDAITKLYVTQDMSERKAKMIELGDAFIAFPGGTGTLEEIAEIMSKVALRHLDAPCILYNLNGYYDGLRLLLDRMLEKELSTPEKLEGITFAASLDDVRAALS